MTKTESPTVLIGNFADRKQAERFVEDLKSAGFRQDQIGVLARHDETNESQVEEGAAAGAITGGVWGVLLALPSPSAWPRESVPSSPAVSWQGCWVGPPSAARSEWPPAVCSAP